MKGAELPSTSLASSRLVKPIANATTSSRSKLDAPYAPPTAPKSISRRTASARGAGTEITFGGKEADQSIYSWTKLTLGADYSTPSHLNSVSGMKRILDNGSSTLDLNELSAFESTRKQAGPPR